MKNKIKLYLLIFFIFVTNTLFAKDNVLTSSVSLVGMSMDYREYDRSGNILDSEKSSYLDLTGVEMSLGYLFERDVSSYSNVEFNLMILGGETEYKGSYLGSGQPYGSVVSTTQNRVIDTDISYKHINFLKKDFEFIYGVGLGYRWWERALSASQIEVYKWYSLRPMIGLSVTIKERIKLGIELEYQYGFDTVMTSSNPKLDFTLGGADIWEVSFPVSYKYKKNIDFFFEATFSKQTIIESNVNSGYYEPDSTAYNNYLKIGAEFKF